MEGVSVRGEWASAVGLLGAAWVVLIQEALVREVTVQEVLGFASRPSSAEATGPTS